MTANFHGDQRPEGWPTRAEAMGNLLHGVGSLFNGINALIWGLVILCVLAGVGRYLLGSNAPTGPVRPIPPIGKHIPKPVPWERIDSDIRSALRCSHAKAEEFAASELAKWSKELEQRIDNDFLPLVLRLLAAAVDRSEGHGLVGSRPDLELGASHGREDHREHSAGVREPSAQT